MKLSLFFVLLCLCLGDLCAFAQDPVIQIALLDKDNRYRISEATVINTRSKDLRQSNLQGIISIPVQIGDTLRISKLDYSPQSFVVNSRKDTVIYLSQSVNLREVNVYGQSRKSEMDEIMQGYRRKGTYFNGKPPALAFLASPITGFYELFGRTPKNARRFQQYMHQEMEATQVDQKFTDQLIVAVTGLSGEDLSNFKFFYRPTYEQVKTWSEYDARVYIEQSFKNFEEKGRPQAPKLVPLQP